MSSIRSNRTGFAAGALILLACPWAGRAQTAVVSISAPSSKVVVNSQLTLAVAFTDIAGTPLDGSSIQWTSSDSTIASVSATGTVQGVALGDVSVTATDPNTGAAGSKLLHIVPGSIVVQASPSQIHVGDSAQLSATALDAAGNPVSGVQYQFRSGQPAVASVAADGSLLGVGEGFATLEARIPAASSDPSLVATTLVHVLPRSAYKIQRILSTDVTANTTIAAYSGVSAENSSEVASIVTLANGNQAALLIENGKPNVLAVVGQSLPNIGRMVVRIDAISANARGDVALLIEYPAQFCSASVVVFPHGGPEQEIGGANCNNGMNARSLAEDGTVIYRLNDQILSAALTGPPKLLFSLATQPAASDPVKNVNDFAPSRVGTFVLNTNLSSGAHVYLYFDGKALTQVYKDGDNVGRASTINTDMPVAAPDGKFYARVNTGNAELLTQFAPGPPQRLIASGDTIAGGRVGWIDSVADAGPNGVLLITDLAVGQYHSSIASWNGSVLTEYAPLAGWGSLVSGAMLSNGTALVSAILQNDAGAPGLRTVSSAGTSSVVLAAGVPFPRPVPAGIDWHYASRAGTGSVIPFRAAGEAVLSVGASNQSLAAIGVALPNGQIATSIGAVSANQSGDMVFTAGYSSGSALFRYSGGKLTTLIDSSVGKTGPQGRSLSYMNNYRGRYLAINSRGDVAATGGFNLNNIGEFDLVVFLSDGPHLVAQQNTPAPGGGNYNNFNTVAIDDKGDVLFIAPTSDGHTAAYCWNGSSVTRVIGTGDPGPSGMTVNEVSNISAGGSGFLIILAFGNYQVRELRSYDLSQLKTLQSSDTTLLDGTKLSYYWGNEATLASNGDVHVMAETQDGLAGVYAHRVDGRDLVAARTRDSLPDGEWLIMPLSVSSTATGDVYFTADVLLNGVETLALYHAIPQ